MLSSILRVWLAMGKWIGCELPRLRFESSSRLRFGGWNDFGKAPSKPIGAGLSTWF